MPRLKERPAPYAAVRRLLLGYEINGPTLERVLSVSRNTAASRLRHPETLTLRELGLIVRNTSIPAEEMREAIKF